MHPEICPLLLVVFECEGPFGFPSGDPDAGTVEAPLMPTVSEAWNCSLCAQSLWHAKSRLPEQRGALSPTCGRTLACTFNSPWTHKRGLGRLGNACAHTKSTHFQTLREDQVHKPGAEVRLI